MRGPDNRTPAQRAKHHRREAATIVAGIIAGIVCYELGKHRAALDSAAAAHHSTSGATLALLWVVITVVGAVILNIVFAVASRGRREGRQYGRAR